MEQRASGFLVVCSAMTDCRCGEGRAHARHADTDTDTDTDPHSLTYSECSMKKDCGCEEEEDRGGRCDAGIKPSTNQIFGALTDQISGFIWPPFS